MSSTTRIRALAAIFAVTTGALLITAGPVQATGFEKAGSGDNACWLNADTSIVQCFDDEDAMSDAIVEQTGSVLADPEAGYASRSAAGVLTTYTLVRFYEDPSYVGDSFTATSTNGAICTTGAGLNGNFAAAWNNRVSSFKSYNSCSTRVYEDPTQGGAWFGYSVNAPGLGALDNIGSSFRAQ